MQGSFCKIEVIIWGLETHYLAPLQSKCLEWVELFFWSHFLRNGVCYSKKELKSGSNFCRSEEMVFAGDQSLEIWSQLEIA